MEREVRKKCNYCNEVYTEEDLKSVVENERYKKVCPVCETDRYLMDLDEFEEK